MACLCDKMTLQVTDKDVALTNQAFRLSCVMSIQLVNFASQRHDLCCMYSNMAC